MSDGSPSTRDRVFSFIVRYKREHDGLSPAIRDIAEGCSISVSTVRYHLMKLEIEDRIRVLGRRAIEVTGGVWNLPPDDAPDRASGDVADGASFDAADDAPYPAPEGPPEPPGRYPETRHRQARKAG